MSDVDLLEAWSADDGARRVRSRFADAFGDRPAGVWAAPGRVNLIGEHTDYNAGLCLPLALPHRTYVALRPRADGVVRLTSVQEDEAWQGHLDDVAPGAVAGWAAYAVGVAWALREAGLSVPGFDAAVDSCVPYGAGLSSSAALECAVAVALDEVVGAGLAGDDAGRTRLAELCVRAENEVAGAPTGGLDQAASLRCRPGHALLLDFHDGSAHHVPAPLAEHGLRLLVVDTRAPHRHAQGGYGERRAACERAAGLLGVPTLRDVPEDVDVAAALGREPDGDVLARRVRHVRTENARVHEVVRLLGAGTGDAVGAVGPVLDASHASLRDDFEVSAPALDLAVAAATGAGALGARMVGGGFGGSAIALVRADDVEDVARAVGAAFASAGLAAPGLLVAEPSAPAVRID